MWRARGFLGGGGSGGGGGACLQGWGRHTVFRSGPRSRTYRPTRPPPPTHAAPPVPRCAPGPPRQWPRTHAGPGLCVCGCVVVWVLLGKMGGECPRWGQRGLTCGPCVCQPATPTTPGATATAIATSPPSTPHPLAPPTRVEAGGQGQRHGEVCGGRGAVGTAGVEAVEALRPPAHRRGGGMRVGVA